MDNKITEIVFLVNNNLFICNTGEYFDEVKNFRALLKGNFSKDINFIVIGEDSNLDLVKDDTLSYKTYEAVAKEIKFLYNLELCKEYKNSSEMFHNLYTILNCKEKIKTVCSLC